jgi:hypothetical protein
MSNACGICLHRRRLELDREIVRGVRLSELAVRFGVDYHSLRCHAKMHISRQLATVMAKKEITVGEELLETINKIITRAEAIFDRNYKDKKDFLALKALDSQRNTIQLLSNISAQLHAAKMAELELERKTAGTDEHSKELEWQRKIQVLTNRELKLYQRLTAKIINQNNDPIRPDNRAEW